MAGGRGERLKPLTDEMPKPMAPVNSRPFLDYLFHSLIEAGIERFVLLTGYKGEVIRKRYGNTIKGKIEIKYSQGKAEDLTGRRVLNAYELLDDYFMLLYGDNYWPVELHKMLRLYDRKKAKVLTTVFSNRKGTGEYGRENNIEVGNDKFVITYDKQRRSAALNGVDIGYFIVGKSVLNPKIDSNVSFEQNILPELISHRHLIAYITDTQYYFITDIESLKDFEKAAVKNKFGHI